MIAGLLKWLSGMHGFVKSKVGDHVDAEDVLQEVMINMWEHREQLDAMPLTEQKLYAYRSIHNSCINLYRRCKKKSSIDIDAIAVTGLPIEDPEYKLQLSMLRDMIAVVKAQHTRAVQIKLEMLELFIARYKYHEIAEIYKSATNTVGPNILNARKLIKQVMQAA
jgi:RNA polymerase sigma-70 factor (ECF subfamily)